MLSPFEDTGEEEALTEIEFRLNAFCSTDDQLAVTSNDLQLDPAHLDVRPIGRPPPTCPKPLSRQDNPPTSLCINYYP